ncbi:two-component response regulator-like aprr7 [Phtheirospermum japonicum]|uniref:Two-component response regulator-like aprr7 n=1 Tax=Phtheirospermum japonicum TaxID=374723 RepID=A0A830BG40_9LAMI|nr:two-component response regulator-like aprr7 [Phtheirospermum japonicum]
MNIDANGKKESPDEDKNHGATSRSQGSGILQQQQPAQGSVVCWERFLHVRTIRVLLVENDDCTRHVVTALLRNCNYEVVDAANGLQAWKVLEDLNNHIDIVLTEVVMPCLSGIVMSSHDSMGLVFKCLSKGAVDFLVKPIRKNELKNLWQHVWRRCHSSSGSGSESGTQTQKSVKSKDNDKPGHNASNGGENDASNGFSGGDGSDDGSGAQSSWTKQAVEVDSSQALSPIDQVAERPDSTCGQVIRSNAEHSDYNKVQLSVAREGHGQKLPDTVEKGNDVETIVHGNVVPKLENSVEGQSNPTVRECESTRQVSNKLDININATDDSKEPHFELSLKRLRGAHDTGGSVQDDRYVLRRSEQSAFSSYVLDNSIEAAKRESVGDIQLFSADQIVYQSSNGVSNNNIDMGSTNKLPKDKSEATSTINGVHPSSAFRPVKNDLRYSPLPNGMQPSSNHVDAPHCGSTNVLSGPVDGESDVWKSGSGDASGSGSGNKVDEIKFAQREAALIKFRQKRKERCFKKKVRYQNRKKLAEQRPRVRGQFVKQTGNDSTNKSGSGDE